MSIPASSLPPEAAFPQSAAAVARFAALAETGSTNDEMIARATGEQAAEWPDLSVIVTDNQTRGRGRLGRSWLAPTGKSLAISALLRPTLPDGSPLPADSYGWFPLLAGAAMTRAVRRVVVAGHEKKAAEAAIAGEESVADAPPVTLKWPNDVQISGYKVSGILSEMLPIPAGGVPAGLVIGAGLNVSLDEHDLPTISSTSLTLVTGSKVSPDAVLAGYLGELTALYRAFLAAGGDAVASGLHAEVSALCGTLGQAVRVELPGGGELLGTAVAIEEDGRLRVREHSSAEETSVAAGDVTHLRY
ncbi:biotin--[acetyl-CoA-carboxylase] ligase [Microterricola viridarii]|uniref:biotin--[biotin carboxyl-carrier protein] ligase n=1 Tax=Microterricola viridarii TaxID=412690 RepID=A0A1H1QWQ2_9MICO|nr:biotin--[acetyl-CoA-carboxylase] ligase [Microterricola viridarii]SDS27299.1 BirA family transcriptional regulator, biotin operon repressor / biotin-[acetyl-CoA-carboxylase] ligase [Microterricola viridarii]